MQTPNDRPSGPDKGEREHMDKGAMPLWRASPAYQSRLQDFMDFVTDREGIVLSGYDSIHQWSVERFEDFWESLWEFSRIKGDKGKKITEKTDAVPWTRFFPDSRISYTENALARAEEEPDGPAVIARTQDGEDRILTWSALSEQVSIWQQALERAGVQEGDRVAVYLPNIPETVIILLAVSNLGAVFSSAGMEMGPDDLISRFGQVNPKILITANGYIHGTRTVTRLGVLQRAVAEIPGIEKTVILPFCEIDAAGMDVFKTAVSVESFLEGIEPDTLSFVRRDFNHPLYILFSSGSTGKPKCFEHSTGGVLLKHVCEYMLNCDVQTGDRVFYHATPSWMMWNWLVSGLVCGATILMYDGSPSYPDSYSQWDFTAQHKCTHHGTAAPIILGWESAKMKIGERYDLSPLRVILSTGAVLPAQGYHFIHEQVKPSVKVSSISGGTDIVGSFVGGNPLDATYAGQVNGPLLGMDVHVWNDEGAEVPVGEAGELVCTTPFPSMPLRFLDDPDGERYASEYFEYYPGRQAWRHGDSIMKTPQGQLVIVGRSDATLNQNGVRIGAVAIYDQLAGLEDRINEAAAVDFTRPDNRQSITVLFLVLSEESEGPEGKNVREIPDDLQKIIRNNVKNNVTPYAIPTEIIAVPGILKTPNGKKAEVVMKKVLAGKDIPNASLYGKDLVEVFARIGRELAEKYGGE